MVSGYGIGASAGNQTCAERVINFAAIDRTPQIIRADLAPQQSGKDPRSFVGCGHCDRTESGGCGAARTFVGSEKVQLVLDDGPADCGSELVTVEGGLAAIVEIVAGIIVAIPVKLPGVAVDLICPGLGNDVNDVAAAESILRGKGIGLDLEFLDGID